MTPRLEARLAAVAVAVIACASRPAKPPEAPAESPSPPSAPRLVLGASASGGEGGLGPAQLDVPYVPTPPAVVEAMLEMAQVRAGDRVYDLGCGDGRIVITAARKHGATGVGVDIDPARIAEARSAAASAGVDDRVKFYERDLFKMDLRDATVVTLYLLPSVNLRLRPKLLSELRPGTRIVSHAFDMGDWPPEREATVDGKKVYLWRVPSQPPAALKTIGDTEAAAAGLTR